MLTQPLGMPFYIGHPDHPRFSGQPGHEDTRAYGRGKEMQVRHDPGCAACAAFANARASNDQSAPCQDHGLFVRMHWNDDGARLISNESFHGHSVNWAALPDTMEKGIQVYRPIRVKSAGFTNEPNIPVRPASSCQRRRRTGGNDQRRPSDAAAPGVPPRLKLIAGFKEDDEVTMEQVIEALEKARPVDKANVNHADLEKRLALERRARATILIEGLLKEGKVITRDRNNCIEQLCNAGDKFDEAAASLANARTLVKTKPWTLGLAGQHAKVVEVEPTYRAIPAIHGCTGRKISQMNPTRNDSAPSPLPMKARSYSPK